MDASTKNISFKKIKRIVARNTLLTYWYFNKAFKVHTNASMFQLEAVISHKVKPINFYNRKFAGAK